jgi:glycine/D-amino acid oxidase-like deaminating enzyme
VTHVSMSNDAGRATATMSDMQGYYRTRSLWLDGVPDSLQPRPSLTGDQSCDIAIVGAGFGGLWTAYYLKTLQPDARVAVVEQEVAGFGAAGRNGGWVSAGIAGSRKVYARKHGSGAVLRAERETHHGVDEIGRVVQEEQIDCGYLKAGALTLATSEPQRARLVSRVKAQHELGLTEEDVRILSASQALEYIGGAAGVQAGAFTPHCARVDPARLARGIATACERRGVTIYERTRATAIEPGVVRCEAGTLRAEVVLRATESYTIQEPGQQSRFLPLYSLMVATEPLPPEVWDELGWRQGVNAIDQRHLYYYAQPTADGRIAIGGRGAPYRLRSPMAEENERNEAVRERLIRTLHEAFPATREAEITHHWGGALAVPRDWCMSVSFDRSSGLGWTGAYGGHGVVAANLGGRTLADLVLGRQTDLVSLPWVSHRSRRWEPEPLRFLASWLIVKTLESADRYEEATGKPARRMKLVEPFLQAS